MTVATRFRPARCSMARLAAVASVAGSALLIPAGALAASQGDLPGQESRALGPLPAREPPDPAQVALGKRLFFESKLSGDGSMSCATCHDPTKAWTDGLALSDAYPGSRYFRNTKTILNAVYAPSFYWDGRLGGADKPTQVRDAITETHFLNLDGRLMLERLKQIPAYVEMFKEAFGEEAEPSFGLTLNAIVAFEETLVSKNAPFDTGKLSGRARSGRELFEGKAGCVRCHSGPYFSDGKAHNLGVPENPAVFSEPMRHMTYRSFMKFLGVPNYMNLRRDVGFFAVSKDLEDVGKFVTPTLREVSPTGPYMHNGTFATLEEVIDFYDRGGGDDPGKSPLLTPLALSGGEKKALLAFLESLSGDEVVVVPPEPLEYELIEDWRRARN